MEKWQRDYIKRNLSELVDLTLCNTVLLTWLNAKDVISDEEFDDINVNRNPKRKARKLYEIVVTRTNAYQLLLEACKKTKQTGVVDILENGKRDHQVLEADESSVDLDSRKTAGCPSNPIFNKKILLKESSETTEESWNTSYLPHDVSEYQEPNLSGAPDTTTNPLDSTPLLTSRLRVDKPSSQKASDEPKSNIKGAFQEFQDLPNNRHEKLTKSLENCNIEQPNTNIGAEFNINADEKLHVTASETEIDKSEDQLNWNSKAPDLNLNQTDNEGRTNLHRALADGASLNVIKNLLDRGAYSKMKDYKGEGALHFAVRGGDKEVISFLLTQNLDVNERDELWETPLHKVRFTKSRDYLEITSFLLEFGADLCANDKNGDNIAHMFAIAENISSEDFQIWAIGITNIGHGHVFGISGQYGRTPLQTAMGRLDVDLITIKLVLESSKEDINRPDDGGSTLLHLALEFGRSFATIQNLISLGADIKIKNKKGSGVLHLAVIAGNKEIVQYLILKGLDVNGMNKKGDTPLHFVSQTKLKNYVELTKLLLDNGGILYSPYWYGNTLAHSMAKEKDVSCDDFKVWATSMIENDHARVFSIRETSYCRTPLYYAMERLDLDLETIDLIIKSAKLDINQPDRDGDTMLHFALIFGKSLDTIKKLVELGADWNKKGKEGRHVMHCAVLGKNKEAFLYFKSLGADVNTKNEFGQTPLHYVWMTRSKDYLGMTKFLLENGANLNGKDSDGKTLGHYMSSYQTVSVEEYGVWKEGLIALGYAASFQKKSLLNRLFSFK